MTVTCDELDNFFIKIPRNRQFLRPLRLHWKSSITIYYEKNTISKRENAFKLASNLFPISI